MNPQLTPEQAELMARLAADIINMVDRSETGNLPWPHVVAALALAGRGVAAHAMAADPDLTLNEARSIMLKQFLMVLGMPSELVHVVESKGEDVPAASFIPVRRH